MWCLRRWAMYFALNPESLPKSTWQIGQTEEDERRRPRGVPIGREGDRAWLDGEEERGWEEEVGSRGGLELEIADGEARESEKRGPETAVIVAEPEGEMGGGEEEKEEEEEDEEWRLVSKGIGECERAEAARSMGGEVGGEGPKVTRGLRTTEVVVW